MRNAISMALGASAGFSLGIFSCLAIGMQSTKKLEEEKSDLEQEKEGLENQVSEIIQKNTELTEQATTLKKELETAAEALVLEKEHLKMSEDSRENSEEAFSDIERKLMYQTEILKKIEESKEIETKNKRNDISI